MRLLRGCGDFSERDKSGGLLHYAFIGLMSGAD